MGSKTINSEKATASKKKQLENLKPFKPGQSGNPAGRQKGSQNLSTILKNFLNAESRRLNPLSEKTESLSFEEAMAAAQIKKALDGDTKAFNAVADRIYGKSITPLVMDVNGGDVFIEFMANVAAHKKAK